MSIRCTISKYQWVVLLVILLLAAALRLFRLGSVPPSLDWDETALGYNAYSILKTGRDEYGSFMPLVFKSFGDYKPGLYIYLAVPFVAIFGLTEFAVRLPSALIGVASVFLLFKLVSIWFGNRALALIAAFVLAMSPWHTHFSRGAWEVNMALFLTLIGLYFFSIANKNNPRNLLISAVSFGLTLLSYQGAKMIIPLLILGLLFFFRRRLAGLSFKVLFSGGLLVFIISLPILWSAVFGGGGRLKVMSVFSYPRPKTEINQILEEDKGSKGLFAIFHNENLAFARGILGRYFNHFSGRFLFFEGDWSSQRHGPSYMGVLYYVDLVFLLLGLHYLIAFSRKGTYEKSVAFFIFYWLFISPLPSALSRDAIQAVRSLNMVLPLSIISTSGIHQIYIWLTRQSRKVVLMVSCLLVGMYIWCVGYYLDLYFIHYPYKSSKHWLYGYKDVVNKIYPIKDKYSKIVFTQKWGQPYIYWLFYSQYDPRRYQSQAKLIENPYGDVGQVERIDNIEFRNIYWPADRGIKNALFIGGEFELPPQDIDIDQAKKIEDIKFLNGEIAFRVVETL